MGISDFGWSGDEQPRHQNAPWLTGLWLPSEVDPDCDRCRMWSSGRLLAVIVQAVTSPEAQWLRGVLEAIHAGSWRDLPVRRWCGRWRAGLLPAGEGLDHDHLPTAARTRRSRVRRLIGRGVFGRRCDRHQPAGKRQAALAGSAGKQAIVADAVEALGQDMEQEAADELLGRQRHDLPAVGAA